MSEEFNPMERELGQSEAKRLLLDKCLRGEFAFVDAGHLQTGEAREQAVSPFRPKGLEPESSQQPEASIGSSTNDSAKSQPAIKAKNNRKSVSRQAFNRFLHLLCRFGPGGATLRPLFHRMRGVKIGKNIWIGDDVYLDNEFPECIELEDGAMIELRATILAHTHGAGRVVIGKNAFIGAGAIVVTAGNRTLVIGEGSVVMASSLVTGSIAPYTLYGSDASKPLARITQPFTASTTYEDFMTSLRPLSR
jgi:acetyltransferase-like isoleucine patch superfamily enzyme